MKYEPRKERRLPDICRRDWAFGGIKGSSLTTSYWGRDRNLETTWQWTRVMPISAQLKKAALTAPPHNSARCLIYSGSGLWALE